MTDPITDMLNRIRNAQAVACPTVNIPFSDLKYEIAKILEKQRFVAKVEKKGKKMRRTIEVTLKYLPAEALTKGGDANQPVISGLKRISKPGQRIYKKAKELKPVKGGYGVAVVSTPKG
ncbi:unnamed protein product, partial [marine sediment metagenome]